MMAKTYIGANGKHARIRASHWPTISITLLLIFSIFFPAGLLTGMNMYFLLLAAIAWFYSSAKFDPNLLRIVVPFALIIAMGIALGINADIYLCFKDAWYIANPAIVISVGFILYKCKPNLASGLRSFVIGGTAVASFYLSTFITQPDLIFQSAVKIRETIGTGYYAPALALTILLAYYKNTQVGILLPIWLARFCIVICTLAAVLCFSRTMLIVVAIGILAISGYFSKNEWTRLAAVLTLSLAIILILSATVDTTTRESQHTFIGKVSRSATEITVEEYSDFKSINENWRGYETARAMKLYYSGNPFQWLAGFGFGQQVDLGLFMPLGKGEDGSALRYIPILHNGYAYLLIKGGAIAVALFTFVLFHVYRTGRCAANGNEDKNMIIAARILQSTSATVAATTWLVSGAFNKSDMFPFLLAAGFLLAAVTHGRMKSNATH